MTSIFIENRYRSAGRKIVLILTAFFFWLCLPGWIRASGATEEHVYVNPIYQGEISASEIKKKTEEIQENSISFYSVPETFSSVDAAGTYVKSCMVNRQEIVTFQFAAASGLSYEEFGSLCKSIVDTACADENAKSSQEGDYLRYHYGGYSAQRQFETGSTLYTITYTIPYYTTYAQEAELTAKLSQVLSGLALSGKSDYEKIKIIYQYLCSHVTYDYNKTEGRYTAYNALIKGTAVCQGYASLLYRMLREAGVGGRVINGTANASDGSAQNHAWNIVPLNGVYYNLDSAWDAGSQVGAFRYFLQNMEDFKNHNRNNGITTEDGGQVYDERDDFTSASFNTKYPMASDSYHQWTIKTVRESTCIKAGERDQVCVDCGKSVFYENLPLAEHTPGLYVTKTASTCVKKGYQVQNCTICNAELNRKELPLEAHTPGNYETKVSSTCTEKGYQVQSCKICSQELNRRELPLEGHVYEKKTLKEATCTEDGIIINVCKACGAEEPGSRITVGAKGHSYTAWTTTRKATIFKTGESVRSCRTCGKKETKTLAKLPSSVKLNVTSLRLQLGKTTTAVKVSKKTSGDSVAYWKSSNTKVAIVNRSTGKIRARAVGTTYISVTMKSGATARLFLRVQRSTVKSTKLTLNRTKLTLKVKSTFRLTVTRTPLTATDTLTFKSSAPKVASVTQKGTVKALKKGTAVITVKAAGGAWVKCRVTVK